MTNSVSPSFVSPASNIASYIDQPSASTDSLSGSSTPALDELPDEPEFPSELGGSRDAATLPLPSLPQGYSHHEMSSPVRTSPLLELPDRIQVTPETISSRDAAPSTLPSFPPQGSSDPQIATALASTPVLASPPKSFWKRFPMFDRFAASVVSKQWKLPRIGSIMQRRHRNVEP